MSAHLVINNNPQRVRITRDVIAHGKPVKEKAVLELDRATIALLRHANAVEDAPAEAPAPKK